MAFMQQMCGVGVIFTQSEFIVQVILPDLAKYIPIILVGIQTLSTLSTVFILYKFGRKSLLLIGNFAVGIIDIGIGLLFYFKSWGPSGYFVFALLIVFNIFYGVTVGPVVRLYLPEILPAKAAPFATMLTWMGSTICILVPPIII